MKMCCHRNYELLILSLILSTQILFANCLLVTPSYINQEEGDSEVHFYCLVSDTDSSYATGIAWRDPRGDIYTPGSPTAGGNERITVDGSELVVYDLNRYDSGDYECFRINNETDVTNGTLFVYALPAILNPIPIQEIYFQATSILVCQIDRGNPPAIVYWLRLTHNELTPNDPDITVITENYDERFTVVENGLEIANVTQSDQGMYRCHVTNEYKTRILDIQAAFRAAPEFVESDVELTVILSEGESKSLDCTAAGAPFPNYTWSVPPHSQTAHQLPLTESILDIQLSDISDAGEYSCTVDNGVGTITRNFIVKIAIAPEPSVEYRNMIINLDKPTQINCSVTALPRPEFKWTNEITNEVFLKSSWNSFYDDVIGISILVDIFTVEDLGDDCTLLIKCLATNTYGRSEQYFTLYPSNSDSCPHGNIDTTTQMTSSPETTLITVANDQGLDGSGDNSVQDGKMDKTTFQIIIGTFAVAVTCIVICVIILLIYFLRHFCPKKKDDVEFSSDLKHKQGDDSIVSSLQIASAGMHSGGSTFSGTESRRLLSVDSGVSISSMQSLLPPHGRGSISSESNQSPPVIPFQMNTPQKSSVEEIYNRLDHGVPSCSSVGSRMMRLSSSSSANSSFPLLQSLQSTSDLESSITSNGSVFFNNNNNLNVVGSNYCGSGVGVSFDHRPPLPQRHRLHSSTKENSIDSGKKTDGMQINLAYETRKKKNSVTTSTDEAPHVYETVA